MAREFIEGTDPAIRSAPTREGRRHLADYPCPYCGSSTLLISLQDFVADKERVELYCDNSLCDIREFTILALRGDSDLPRRRVDVRALQLIDRGTEAEMEAEGHELIRDESGDVIGSTWPGLGAGTIDFTAPVRRRQRDANVSIDPLD